jgi:hypothetical protein
MVLLVVHQMVVMVQVVAVVLLLQVHQILDQAVLVVLVVLELHHQSTQHQQQELAVVEEVQLLPIMMQEVLVGLAVVEKELVVDQELHLQEQLTLVVVVVDHLVQAHLFQVVQEDQE